MNDMQGSELPPQLFVALKENANLKLRLGRHEEAISSLESLRKYKFQLIYPYVYLKQS